MSITCNRINSNSMMRMKMKILMTMKKTVNNSAKVTSSALIKMKMRRIQINKRAKELLSRTTNNTSMTKCSSLTSFKDRRSQIVSSNMKEVKMTSTLLKISISHLKKKMNIKMNVLMRVSSRPIQTLTDCAIFKLDSYKTILEVKMTAMKMNKKTKTLKSTKILI